MILLCEEDDASWRVLGETANHGSLWSAWFGGPVEDRPADIGRFVAEEGESRRVMDSPAPRPPRHLERPATSAVPPTPSALPPLVFSPQEMPPSEERGEDERARARAHEGGISLDGFLGVDGRLASGVHGTVAFSVGEAKIGVAAAYASDETPARFVRAGVVTALGAPWDSRVLGASLEVGGSFAQPVVSSWYPGETRPEVHFGSWGSASPYAQWTIVVQMPAPPVHPWIGTSALFVVDPNGGSTQTLSLVGGMSWNAW
jgi:hypothetical protein